MLTSTYGQTQRMRYLVHMQHRDSPVQYIKGLPEAKQDRDGQHLYENVVTKATQTKRERRQEK